MPRTRIGRSVALALGLMITGVGATAAMAQGAPGAFEQFLAALAQLQTSVNSVQQSVNALGASSNVRFTPAVAVFSGTIVCTFVNVTNAARQVHLQLINQEGNVVIERGGTPATEAGEINAVAVVAPAQFGGYAYCKFTVLDGTKADIRANLHVTTGTPDLPAGEQTTVLSVTAE